MKEERQQLTIPEGKLAAEMDAASKIRKQLAEDASRKAHRDWRS